MAWCPVRCGECCLHDQWTFLFSDELLERGRKLREEQGWHGTIEEAWYDERCLFLGERGCTLTRVERPSICKVYLCDKAVLSLSLRKKQRRKNASGSRACHEETK